MQDSLLLSMAFTIGLTSRLTFILFLTNKISKLSMMTHAQNLKIWDLEADQSRVQDQTQLQMYRHICMVLSHTGMSETLSQKRNKKYNSLNLL